MNKFILFSISIFLFSSLQAKPMPKKHPEFIPSPHMQTFMDYYGNWAIEVEIEKSVQAINWGSLQKSIKNLKIKLAYFKKQDSKKQYINFISELEKRLDKMEKHAGASSHKFFRVYKKLDKQCLSCHKK